MNGFVYVYNLPPKFNKALLIECENWNPWVSRCKAISNDGLGPRATGLASIVPKNLASSWYWTDMFAGEVIYHTRILNYKCRTLNPDLATAFYVPFYAGLAIEEYLFKNYTAKERDMQSETLLKWTQDQKYYTRSNGSDHFVMVGRMTWDFRRTKDEDWGSSFINMPGMKNITRLSVEQDPWDPLEVSVPYPTGLHPKSDLDLQQWQHFVQSRNRTSLYTFVGGKRKMKNDFRALLHNHCFNNSDSCRAVDCSKTKCHDGASVILEAFLDSDFCLQPRGDAYTRRSMFDCMLAGSIPVFFWNRSIYHQYGWFLNDDPGSFSVFIDKKEVQKDESVIRRVLEQYSREDIGRMRENVIGLIPRFVYAMPSNKTNTSIDAFDIAMDGVLKKFKEQKGHGSMGKM
ncbi:hypothetical protein Leryth_013679 [Lithospermum erythrorhizon]|nr:hypothetical protein Leryth_013679 [Lithospermum erythrorhizon]